jgi:rubredoxin-NAD+ reductase
MLIATSTGCGKQIFKEEFNMKYVCDVCGWVFDEAVGDSDYGIAPCSFDSLPEDFECPLCGVGKDSFSPEE